MPYRRPRKHLAHPGSDTPPSCQPRSPPALTRCDWLSRVGRLPPTLPSVGLTALVLNLAQYRIDVGSSGVLHEPSRQHGIRPQLTRLVELPYLLRIPRFKQLRRGAAERRAHIMDIALQHGEGIVVAGGVYRVRQIDDPGAAGIEQHVELAQ